MRCSVMSCSTSLIARGSFRIVRCTAKISASLAPAEALTARCRSSRRWAARLRAVARRPISSGTSSRFTVQVGTSAGPVRTMWTLPRASPGATATPWMRLRAGRGTDLGSWVGTGRATIAASALRARAAGGWATGLKTRGSVVRREPAHLHPPPGMAFRTGPAASADGSDAPGLAALLLTRDSIMASSEPAARVPKSAAFLFLLGFALLAAGLGFAFAPHYSWQVVQVARQAGELGLSNGTLVVGGLVCFGLGLVARTAGAIPPPQDTRAESEALQSELHILNEQFSTKLAQIRTSV